MPIPNLGEMNPTSWSWTSIKQHSRSFGTRLTRTRPIEAMRDDRRKSIAVTKLPRVLNTLDLTSLGVGSCVGTGMYVVSGLVAKEVAGPAVILSFIIAGVASLLSGMCYAEFGVRVPKTSGSAYTYSYVTVGEFTAFFIGWNLILEYLIGTASGASALSSMMDSLSNRTIGKWMVHHLGNLPSIGGHDDPYSYPDIIALMIALAMTIVVAAGVRNSVLFNNILNAVNIVIWIFLVVAGTCFVDFSNWTQGDGFLPYGWNGVLSGAATCFYAYIGFDIIATTGEECQKPHKSIPYAILASLCVCLTAYVTVSGLLTLVVPYQLINSESPLLEMFHHTSFPQAQYIITIGAVTGLTVSLLGSLFPMPRVIYAMASDGLLFRCLAHVFPYTETPAVATVVSGVIAALLALTISLRDLIEMMSIGTLLAYTLVSLSVLLLRYQHDVTVKTGSVHFRHVGGDTLSTDMSEPEEEIRPEDCETMETEELGIGNESDATGLVLGASKQKKYGAIRGNSSHEDAERELMEVDKENLCGDFWRPVTSAISYRWGIFTDYMSPYTYVVRTFLGLPGKEDEPTPESHKLASRYILILSGYSVILNIFLVFGSHHLATGAWWAIILLLVMLFIFAFLVLKICQQPQNPTKLAFMTPCLPFLPVTAIWFNTYLMLRLSPLTWVRFVIWCIIGLFVYFGYGVWNSGLETPSGTSQETYEGGEDLGYNDINNQTVGYQARGGLQGVTVHQSLAKAEAVLRKQDDADQLMEDYDAADGE